MNKKTIFGTLICGTIIVVKIILLISYFIPNANVDARDKDNWTALHWAAMNGHTETAISLLDRGADVNATANYGDDPNGTLPSVTALHLAAIKGHIEIVRVLLNRSANINARDKNNLTPLHWAVLKGHTETVIYLLDKGSDVNAMANYINDPNGTLPSVTALHSAAKQGHTDIVRALLNRSANVNARDISGNTPLHFAAMKGHTEIVGVLINRSANIDARNKKNWTPLHWAAYNGSTEIVIDLLNKGSDVNATANYRDDPNGTIPSVTALHLAAMNGHTEIVRALLSYGADVNVQDRDGETPLHYAVRMHRINVVRLIISKIPHNAAVLSIKNNKNETALDIAKSNGYSDIVEALRNAGASRKKRRNAIEGELQQ